MDLRALGAVFGQQINLKGACCKLELGWCSFASRARGVNSWRGFLSGSAGHRDDAVQGKGHRG